MLIMHLIFLCLASGSGSVSPSLESKTGLVLEFEWGNSWLNSDFEKTNRVGVLLGWNQGPWRYSISFFDIPFEEKPHNSRLEIDISGLGMNLGRMWGNRFEAACSFGQVHLDRTLFSDCPPDYCPRPPDENGLFGAAKASVRVLGGLQIWTEWMELEHEDPVWSVGLSFRFLLRKGS